MDLEKWDKIRMSEDENDEQIWDLFHENSKISNYYPGPSDEAVLQRMQTTYESLQYKGYRKIELPKPKPLTVPLENALINRTTTNNMIPCVLTLEDVATLLHYSYGITRQNRNAHFPRFLRVVPSAGGLYPLEIFFYSSKIKEHAKGIYHYNPVSNNLRLLKVEDNVDIISESLVQKNIAYESSLIIFITAIFKKSTFKYSNRGYRFILLEAGHVAQNINIVSSGLGLGCINVGGFFDHKIDAILELDGILHSTIYVVAIGKGNGAAIK